MEYAQILKEISSKLSGDHEKDAICIFAEIEKYKNHTHAVEIHKGILRLFWDTCPDGDKGPVMRIAEYMDSFIDNILHKVNSQVSEGRLAEAEKMIKSVLPTDGDCKEGEESDCFWFNDLMEELIYRYKYSPEKETLRDPYGKSKIYFIYACVLFEQKKYDDALRILEKGLKYNPVNTELLIEESEIFKLRKDWTTYKRITDMCLEYSYKSKDVARAFRNYGFMFIEQEDYDAAICCYLLSTYYDNHETAASELYHISKMMNKTIDEKYFYENLKNILMSRGLQIGPSKDILNLAHEIAVVNEERQEYKLTLYFYKVCFDLSRDDDIRQKIELISNMTSGTKH